MRVITKVDERATHAFTLLKNAEELDDNNLVLLDGIEHRVSRLKFSENAVSSVARQGSGPRELSYPVRLIRLPDRRVAVDDASNERWLVLNATGSPDGFVDLGGPMSVGRALRRQSGLAVPNGEIVSEARRSDGKEFIARWNPRTGRAQEIAPRLSDVVRFRTERSDGVEVSAGMARVPAYVVPPDLWTASVDGWVAIVTSVPYSVTFFPPTGGRVAGGVIGTERSRLTARTREARMRELARQRGRQEVDGNRYQWPSELPVVDADRFETLRFAPDGKLWVRRTSPAEANPSYDVFDRTGKLVERVALPVDVRLLLLGRTHIYVVLRDEDDLEYVGRVRFTY